MGTKVSSGNLSRSRYNADVAAEHSGGNPNDFRLLLGYGIKWRLGFHAA